MTASRVSSASTCRATCSPCSRPRRTSHWRKLTELNVECNLIRNVELDALAKELKHVKYINLANNQLAVGLIIDIGKKIPNINT